MFGQHAPLFSFFTIFVSSVRVQKKSELAGQNVRHTAIENLLAIEYQPFLAMQHQSMVPTIESSVQTPTWLYQASPQVLDREGETSVGRRMARAVPLLGHTSNGSKLPMIYLCRGFHFSHVLSVSRSSGSYSLYRARPNEPIYPPLPFHTPTSY